MLYACSACIKHVLRVDKKHKMLNFLFFSLTYFHNYLKQLNLLKILSAYYVFDFDFFLFFSFFLSFFQIYLDLVMT